MLEGPPWITRLSVSANRAEASLGVGEGVTPWVFEQAFEELQAFRLNSFV